jgi:uncharacterized cupredoxin-like copper-binding protein
MTTTRFLNLGAPLLAPTLFLAVAPPPVQAEGDLTKQDPILMPVQLGDEHDALRFVPDVLTFETGKLYKLEIHNASQQKHYFSSDRFSGAVFTRKVQVNGQDGKAIAEVKGNVREIEIYPGQKAEWWFVPVKAGTFDDLRCTIPGHADSGMVGRIVVK